jgi:hypothetical protein
VKSNWLNDGNRAMNDGEIEVEIMAELKVYLSTITQIYTLIFADSDIEYKFVSFVDREFNSAFCKFTRGIYCIKTKKNRNLPVPAFH